MNVLSNPVVSPEPASIPNIVLPCGLPDKLPGTNPEYSESVSIKKGYAAPPVVSIILPLESTDKP